MKSIHRHALAALLTFAALFALALGLVNLMTGCASTSLAGANADPEQVAKLSAVSATITQIGATAVLTNNPGARGQLIAVAEAIEQAAALPDAPAPTHLTDLVSTAAAKFGGPYGAIASLALQSSLALYQRLYVANQSNPLDKQPAFRAVLLAMASGLRAAASPATASSPPPPADLTDADLLLRPARN